MMGMSGRRQFLVDEKGEKLKVVLAIEEYERMLDQLEELESIRAYDEAKAAGDEAVPFDEAVREIESSRR